MTKINEDKPQGNLVLRTLAMPADTNANGDIFGGWLMSQMDLGGAILAKEIAKSRVVTACVDKILFYTPVSVGDVVCCYASCTRIGRSSLDIKVEIWTKKLYDDIAGKRSKVTAANFTYVAIGDDKKSRAIPRENNPELEYALALIEQNSHNQQGDQQ